MSAPHSSENASTQIRSVTRLFWLWLVVRTLVWVLTVVVSHSNAPLDLIEWLSWGHVWQWGYSKHPPLPAWLADAAARLSTGEVWPVYALGYGFTAVTILAAWQLAREYLPPRLALLSVVCLDGVMYMTNDPAEFSNNVVLNTGWAWLTVVWFRAVRTGSIRWWMAVGVVLGLTILSKYTIGVLVSCLIGYTLWDRQARRVWRTPGPYWAAAMTVLTVFPHLLWLIDNHFLPFRYAVARSIEKVSVWDRLIFPAQFIGGQLLHGLPILFILWPAMRDKIPTQNEPETRIRTDPDPRFLDAVVIGPVIVLVTVSVVTGAVLREIWGSPLWTFLGVWLLVRFGRLESETRWSSATRRWAVMAVAFVAFTLIKQLAGPHLTGKGERPHFPGRPLADEVNRLWSERYAGYPPIVGGEGWRAGNVACYSPHRPAVFTSGVMGYLVMDEVHCPWTSDAEVNASGAAIVWDADMVSNTQIDELKARFPWVEMLPVVELAWQTTANLKPTRVGVALVPPAIARSQ